MRLSQNISSTSVQGKPTDCDGTFTVYGLNGFHLALTPLTRLLLWAVGLLALVIVALNISTESAYAQGGTYSTVVDNSQEERFYAPGWGTSAYSSQRYGESYAFARPSRSQAARFKVNIPATGRYTVYSRWPANPGYNASTPFSIRTTDGLRWKRVNQQRNGGKWVKLGEYRLGKGDGYKVLVSRYATGNEYVIADAVKVAKVSDQTTPTRGGNELLGAPMYDEASVKAYARSIGASSYILKAIPYYYDLAPRIGIAPDVLVAQSILETNRGYYGGDSKPWNMAGIKKGGIVGDEPEDFERPKTPYQGVRMHVNHMAAYTGKKPIGTPHDRFYDARAAQKSRGYWVTKASQLGGGVWATDPYYSGKIRRILDSMKNY